ncbi:unnamed protein product [Parnassius apollo]|uniref:(apollo) hypothetical protein n=1 Tax=Parnassius apollo TaxID=110799 RepID=A0A8S3Y5E5_PARAO|nr:unnamed protein product [Parnassius apollo]
MSALLDADAILSDHEEWMKLDEEWGNPIDLDTEDDQAPYLRSVFSTLDLMKTTFDSSFLFKKVRRKVGRKLSKRSASSFLDYKDFLNDMQKDATRESSKQFYFVSGQIISAVSVEEICDKIDNYFKSIEKLAFTSTIRKKKPVPPEVVKCSISSEDFSFDDTEVGVSSTEKGDTSELNRFIDQAFDNFNSSIASMENIDQSTRESVTTLVRKFSNVMKSPMNCSPRRKRQCCEKFRDLAEFWKKRAMGVAS